MSITGQHASNLARIEDLGGALGLKLEDQGKSAWRKGVVREGWDRLLARLENGDADGVVIFDIERLIRRVEDALRIVKMAERGFKVYDSDMEYDLDSASGQKSFIDAANAGQYYSRRLSDRVKRGNRQKAVKGESRVGRDRPFGFEKDGQTIRESEARYVREAVRRRLAGETWSAITEWIRSEGVTTTRGNQWSPSNLRKCVSLPRMAGYARIGEELFGRMSGDPILKEEDWQTLLQLNAVRGRPRVRYYLATGIVLCSDCELPISGRRVSTKRRPYEDGTQRIEYGCRMYPKLTQNDNRHRSCMKQIADGRTLDAILRALVIARLSDPRHVGALNSRVEAKRQAAKPYQEKVARLSKLRDGWDDQVIAGKISVDRHAVLVEKLEAEIREAAEALEAIEAEPAVVIPKDETRNVQRRWDKSDVMVKRQMLKTAFSGYRILVEPGRTTTSAAEVKDRIRIVPVKETPGGQRRG